MALTLVVIENLLRDALSVVMSDSETDYQATLLYDNHPGRYARFLTNTTPRVTADLQLLRTGALNDGSFDTWVSGAPRGWSVSSVTEELVDVISGSAVKCAGNGAAYRSHLLRAGAWYRYQVQAKATGGGTAALRVYNKVTAKWLQSDGTWGASSSAATRTAGTYAEVGISFQMESYSVCRADRAAVELRLTESSGGGTALFDDALLVPGVDFSSIHWHNITPGRVVKLQSSDDASSWTDRHTFVLDPLTFWGRLSQLRYHRYWREDLSGGSAIDQATVFQGELVLAQAIELLKQFTGLGEGTRFPQTRHATRAGEELVNVEVPFPVRTRRWSFRHHSAAVRAQCAEILDRTRYGGRPLVIVPLDTEPVVLFCRPREEREERREQELTESELMLRESPGPAIA